MRTVLCVSWLVAATAAAEASPDAGTRVPGAGVLLAAPADLSWGRGDVLVQPDLFVVPLDMTRRALELNTWAHVRHLVLAIEVLSGPEGSRVILPVIRR